MRKPEYLSPTSVAKFYEDRTQFYLDYIADNRTPRIKQTEPMSVGAAFDAYVKSYIADKLFGGLEGFAWDELFESQVEEHNRDWAKDAGTYIFEQYKKSGALADLMLELGKATYKPRLESTVKELIPVTDDNGVVHHIPVLGKPDLWFIVEEISHIILDWKVNGYCATRTTSPKPGYTKVRGSWGRGNGDAHKDAQLMLINGIMVNVAHFLETIDEKWARQTCLYSWVLGEEIGSKFICGIDQCVFKPTMGKPDMRVASFRSRISESFQKKVAKELIEVWTACETGKFFETDNEETCASLDIMYRAYEGDTEQDEWFRKNVLGA